MHLVSPVPLTQMPPGKTQSLLHQQKQRGKGASWWESSIPAETVKELCYQLNFPFPCDLRQETEDLRQWKCAPKGSRATDARRGVLIGWAYKGGSQLTRMEMASGPDASVLIVLSAFS